jgi:hypothetical protein
MALGDGTLFCGWEDNTIRLYNVEVRETANGHKDDERLLSRNSRRPEL